MTTLPPSPLPSGLKFALQTLRHSSQPHSHSCPWSASPRHSQSILHHQHQSIKRAYIFLDIIDLSTPNPPTYIQFTSSPQPHISISHFTFPSTSIICKIHCSIDPIPPLTAHPRCTTHERGGRGMGRTVVLLQPPLFPFLFLHCLDRVFDGQTDIHGSHQYTFTHTNTHHIARIYTNTFF
jgi:hypothetical protein